MEENFNESLEDVDELGKEYEKDFGEEFDVDELAKEYEEDFEEFQEYENVDSQSILQVYETSEMQVEDQEDPYEENEELYNTDSLRVELIQNGKIKENIQEFLDLGLMKHPIKNFFIRSELDYIENCKFISYKIAIIDIETTGFNPLIDSIIEIGIVELDLSTGEKKILFNSVIKDPNYNSLKCYNNPFLKDISIDPREIENAKLLELYRDILQLIFNSYKITAYNSKFDFRFLENRGFNIPRKLMDVMKVCQKIIIKENSLKFEEVYRYFYNTPQNESKKILTNSNYVSIHRAIDDAIHETELLYYLILEYNFPLTYQKKLLFKKK